MPAILFSIYFLIGLVLLVVAVASPGKERRTKGFAAFGGGDVFDAGMLIFIVLLWPIWLFTTMMKKDPKL